MSLNEIEQVRDKVRIVVNRVGLDAGQISLKKAQETIGREIFWQLPNDYRVMVEVRNNGVPLIEQAPRAAITQSILSLTDTLCGAPEAEGEPVEAGTMGRWLNFLPGRVKAKRKA
jgi:pilus assembly protein CpaE